jgi:YHS domain-containing protein/uncharacterized membrane protein YraQ (UPF0718 family)
VSLAEGPVLALTAGAAIDDLGRALRESLFMFWETLWPLVLGFGLSGAVQAFVSREQMQSRLGDHRPLSVLRATGYGMASSSCSYAASAMAKSLFQKGADFVSALVFMFASTNLVVELGIVLVVLMGWPFMAAELTGGPVMIVLLVLVAPVLLSPVSLNRARERLGPLAPSRESEVPASGRAEMPEASGSSRTARIMSLAGWSDAASYTLADLTMLRREMAVGYLVAGFLATLVPAGLWNTAFMPGHGMWTSLENALVGPPIAFVAFVCSIGNVPMAAALWKSGINFGGVISFIFADLLAAPLVLIYRRYYGVGLTLRLVGLFWAVMSAAGLVVQAVFSAAGLVPRHRPTRLVPTTLAWNYTTVLNIVFLLAFAGLYWLYRHRERLGGGTGYATDPVCRMQVRVSEAPAHRRLGHQDYWFCSDHCAIRFDAHPERYRSGATGSPEPEENEEDGMAKDPVCGMTVDPATAAAVRSYEGRNYFFCATGCAEAFEAEPARYLGSATPAEG